MQQVGQPPVKMTDILGLVVFRLAEKLQETREFVTEQAEHMPLTVIEGSLSVLKTLPVAGEEPIARATFLHVAFIGLISLARASEYLDQLPILAV